jgi:NADH-quinone oxidoreductase subunit M
MYKRVIFGAIANPTVAGLHDADRRELVALGLLAAAVLAMGVYPRPLTDAMHASVGQLLQQVSHSKLPPGL